MIEAANLMASPFTPQPSEDALVFVYGTLKAGGALHESLERLGAELVDADARIEGRLYKLPWAHFPQALPANGKPGEQFILGELWSLPDGPKGLRLLDHIEGVGVGLYERKQVWVYCPDVSGRKYLAWVYFYTRGVPGEDHRLAGGRWPLEV